jgi:hypothetical protein
MANSLLDFVMSLVRDPDAAARYNQDPSQAIADAHLTDVTSADVNNLIPVVSESLSMGAPAAGADAAPDGNVWASGAATAAFDAFADHVPDQTVSDPHAFPTSVVDQLTDHPVDASADYVAGSGTDLHTFDSTGLDQTPASDFHVIDDVQSLPDDPGTLDHPVIEDHGLSAEAPSFDIFE